MVLSFGTLSLGQHLKLGSLVDLTGSGHNMNNPCRICGQFGSRVSLEPTLDQVIQPINLSGVTWMHFHHPASLVFYLLRLALMVV